MYIIAVRTGLQPISATHEWSAHMDGHWRVTPHRPFPACAGRQPPLLDNSGHEVNVELNQPCPTSPVLQDLSRSGLRPHGRGGVRWRGIRYAPYGLLRRWRACRCPFSSATVREGLGGRLINTNTGT